jgi:hypothetical protein
VYIKQFRIPEAHRKAVEDHVKELLKLGVVRPSRSKYNSPVFIVTKKDGGLRIVQDFRALNQKTLVDKYSMRDVQECIDEIGRAGSTIFSAIDLTAGFWQMLLEPECRKFTAFTLPGVGQFEWNASPMGLLGAPGSFQRLMEIVIHNLKNVIAYIDGLLVHTKDHNQHLEILDELSQDYENMGSNSIFQKVILDAKKWATWVLDSHRTELSPEMTNSKQSVLPYHQTTFMKSDSFSDCATSSEAMSRTLHKSLPH